MQSALWVNQWPHALEFALPAQSIHQAYTRGALGLNGVMAGREAWEPLPTTPEQVRPAVPVVEGEQ
jgi:hypothetical protein